MRLIALTTSVLVASCAAPSASQGGVEFRAEPARVELTDANAPFAVCWPADATSDQRIELTFEAQDVRFETRNGATNSTGRCLREIATSVVWKSRPATLELAPPKQPIDGWAVVNWVGLLSPGRFGPERGVVDPGPWLSACVEAFGPIHPGFHVQHVPGYQLTTLSESLTDSDRCAEAALSATAWPSPRELFFEFGPRGRPTPVGEVALYGAPRGDSTGVPLDPVVVKDVLRLASADVGACWDEALRRRTAIGGPRTFRFRVDGTGSVVHAWVAGLAGETGAASDLMLDRCLARVVRAQRFPPVAGEGVYTWRFATR